MFKIKKKDIVTTVIFVKQFLKARKIITKIDKLQSGEGLVIVPCDPETVIGSRGDEAMIKAVISNFRRKCPQEPIYILANGEMAVKYLDSANLDNNIQVIECWNNAYPFERLFKEAVSRSPREAVIIGADCIDGAYAPYLSLDLICMYVALQKTEIPTYITGFSYNSHPYSLINHVVKYFKPKNVNLRDNVSLKRFERKTNVKGSLVADVAFMLDPDCCFEEYNAIKAWVDNNHFQKNQVLAFNFHPMLRHYDSKEEVLEDAASMAVLLARFLNENPHVSVLLLPHDDRNRISDSTMLDKIYSDMKELFHNERLMYLRKVPRASQLKAIAALMDGVVSSRMHLAIAALGSGVPVMVADYQGKFEGLFNHFSLPHNFILSPSDFCSESLCNQLRNFMYELSTLKGIILENLPKVKTLSRMNFTYEPEENIDGI